MSFASRVIRWYQLIHSTWYRPPDQVTTVIMCIYHTFSHGDVSYGFNGKNVSFMLGILFIFRWIKSKNCRNSNLRNSENNWNDTCISTHGCHVPYAESNHVRTKVNKCVYLSNHYYLCATINHCQWHSIKRYNISILMKNTDCSLERTGGG